MSTEVIANLVCIQTLPQVFWRAIHIFSARPMKMLLFFGILTGRRRRTGIVMFFLISQLLRSATCIKQYKKGSPRPFLSNLGINLKFVDISNCAAVESAPADSTPACISPNFCCSICSFICSILYIILSNPCSNFILSNSLHCSKVKPGIEISVLPTVLRTPSSWRLADIMFLMVLHIMVPQKTHLLWLPS